MASLVRRLIGQFGSLLCAVLVLLSVASVPLYAQGGLVRGTVTRATDGSALANVQISVEGTDVRTVTNVRGEYSFRVTAGTQTILFRWLGFQPFAATVNVSDGGTHTVDAALEAQAIMLGELTVSGASRAPERVVEAPAAVTLIEPQLMRAVTTTAQPAQVLITVPGVDVVQSGVNDFNVNARGFNSTLNRRVLVLQDGRDLAIAFLGAQEWNGMSVPLEDLQKIEMVRGPGSALYGANAFAGVLSIRTPTAREVVGTKFSVAGGELSTFKADVRHAGVTPNGRVGYRVNAGYYRSDTWTRSRTLLNGASLRDEYDDPAAQLVIETTPLSGQTVGTGGVVSGDRDPLQNIYGSGRFDYYLDNGSIFTVEGGATQVENEVFVTGIGRVQVEKGFKPWTRVNYAHPNFDIMAWWTGRRTLDPQVALASRNNDGSPGRILEETSDIIHFEGQYNRMFLDGKARIVVGSSFRNYSVDTDGTLMNVVNDDRSDKYYSAYGQLEFFVTPEVRLVLASRVDEGDLFDTEFSPKAALVISPTEEHSIRFTVNRAFQTPNYSEFFLQAPAGAPADFTLLEAGLRASPLGAALAGVPVGELFGSADGSTTDLSVSSAVPILALGNDQLDVEHVTSFEVGYSGLLGDRVFLSLTGYWSRLTDFVTDLLPGVNPAYGGWTAPDAVPSAFAGALEDAVAAQLAGLNPLAAAGLTRLQNGNTAVVVSYANAGKVDEKGVELGLGVAITPELRADVTYTYFDFEIKDQLAGDELLPNTPKNKGTIGLSYSGQQGFDFNVNARLTERYQWAAGIFEGPIPATTTFNASIGFQFNNYIRVHANATNIFNQERYHLYGGSVIGRRVLAGTTLTF